MARARRPAASFDKPAEPFNDLAIAIHAWARRQGFYDREFAPDSESRYANAVPNPCAPAEKLCLIHSEVSEALEALRDDDAEAEAEEIADVVIRVLDYAAWRGIDLDAEVAAKVEKNEMRPRLHGRAGF
jgi:NTP pyrophosphatase (non-canonical NTP hydrolase)